MRTTVQRMERHQVPLYLIALAFGAAVGLLVPAAANPAEIAINPAIGLLLYATFLGIPFVNVGKVFRDWRFLVTVLAVNFIIVPIVVFILSRIVAHDQVLLVGVLFVLLTPCVDYVIVFAGLAGGARDRLLAAAPLLMLVQMLLLPPLLSIFLGEELVATIDLAPLVEAFLLLIALPLGAAVITQLAVARTGWAAPLQALLPGVVVPLVMLTLALVVASQVAGVGAHLGSLLLAIPIFILFAAVMVPIGMLGGRIARVDVPSQRAIVFSVVTRNSLVILPLVLALPPEFELTPLVVVSQTFIELVLMIVFVRLIPRLIPNRVRERAAEERGQSTPLCERRGVQKRNRG